jgi:FPC/CPF motif-containing protein YcgG
MNQIAKTLYQAIVAHTAWKQRLRQIIDKGENQYDIDIEHCQFGQWLKKEAEELKKYEHYQEVIDLHREFHQQADNIIQLALKGKVKEANAAIEYGKYFDHISQELVKNLIAWHDQIH